MSNELRIVDLLWITADKGGTRHYRADLPAAHLARSGYTTFVGTEAGSAPNGLIYALDGQWPVFGRAVIMQRQGAENGSKKIAEARAAGQHVWIDCDDLLTAAPADNFARAGQGQTGIAWWARMLPAATGLLCSTDQIAEGLRKHNRRQLVVPNMHDGDDTERWRPYRGTGRESPQNVGWVGNTVVHRANLAVCRPWLADTLERHGLSFSWSGLLPELEESEATMADLLGIPEAKVYARPAAPITTYPDLFRTIDIGLAPLADSRFSRAKTATKGLEYAAAGVPFLYSDHPAYVRLFGQAGRCRHAGDWRAKVARIVTQPEWRAELAESQYRAMLAYTERSRQRWQIAAPVLMGKTGERVSA